MLANATVDSVEERFVDIVGLDIRTIRVLRLIGNNPGITFAEIAKLGALERSLTSRLIQTLVRNGLVERRNDENDARRFGLYITSLGQQKRNAADVLSELGLEMLFLKLEPDEVAAFIRTMEKLADWIDSDEFERQIRQSFANVARKLK
ncbi:MarR family winged helix-turn-helix transcriptional regulator [Paracoccus sp. (in: a-proteobacteria)]|uniref:MarR family winged helix-turn-helix transcriptional regulator n=1 Tax=Paracoccus sp. TaxID=267 RepID=UPI003A8C4BFE